MRLRTGETEAVGWRVVPLGEVVRLLGADAALSGGRPRLIAIDGRGGSGKTTLAALLSAAVPHSAVVHTDDLAWNHAYFAWAELLATHILRPLHRGEPVDFRPGAWTAHGRPGSITVPATAPVVWVEGTGAVRAELAGWLDASVWMQGDLDAQERRTTLRDGDATPQREHVTNWLREETPFLARERPWEHATLIVGGPAPLAHDPRTELVIAPPG
ncbi:uridine kinase [Streptomyces sp. NPDC087440]|uniref:uridine kinase family protein n=1 Tax=Streptomyces sp. NPDC087440 TaxID=3365790 RepID=UPI003804B530